MINGETDMGNKIPQKYFFINPLSHLFLSIIYVYYIFVLLLFIKFIICITNILYLFDYLKVFYLKLYFIFPSQYVFKQTNSNFRI